MSKKKRYWTLYLMDMLESIRRIEVYTKDIGYEEFLRNNMIKDAVVRNIEGRCQLLVSTDWGG
jgi:uncharacterized protein with HEPN domain